MQTQTLSTKKRLDQVKSFNFPIKAIFDVNLGKGHQGLSEIAASLGVKTDSLDRGQFVLFLNKAQTAVKVFASNNVVAYYKNPDRKPMTMVQLANIPRCFNGHSFEWNIKLEKQLSNKLIG